MTKDKENDNDKLVKYEHSDYEPMKLSEILFAILGVIMISCIGYIITKYVSIQIKG